MEELILSEGDADEFVRLAGSEGEADEDAGGEGWDALVGAVSASSVDAAEPLVLQMDSLVLEDEDVVINSGLEAE